MYSRCLLHLYDRSLYRVSSSIRFHTNKLSYVTNKDEEKQKSEIVATKFPGYTVIYVFPYIKFASTINVMKRRFTYLTGMIIPVIAGLQLADIMSFNVAAASIVNGITITTLLYFNGIFCNNLVGYIYFNPDKQKTIISYVNYQGKRIDMEITIDKIIPLLEKEFGFTEYFYRKISFWSQEEQLKINLRLGQIIDQDSFKQILGMIK